jgi:hypothetical protein
MLKLSAVVRRFIVVGLARFDSPSEVARLVKEEFGIEVSRQAVMAYNPDCLSGAALSRPLKDLFFSSRREFVQSIEKQPIGHLATRLRRLEKHYQAADQAGNTKVALRALDAARREMEIKVIPDE